jgi:hypothetical protein
VPGSGVGRAPQSRQGCSCEQPARQGSPEDEHHLASRIAVGASVNSAWLTIAERATWGCLQHDVHRPGKLPE